MAWTIRSKSCHTSVRSSLFLWAVSINITEILGELCYNSLQIPHTSAALSKGKGCKGEHGGECWFCGTGAA